MSAKPWEVQPALSEEKLMHLGNVIKTVRAQAVELYEPEAGDGPWSLGCRVYERTINAIHRESREISWLEVERNGLYMLIFIDGIPVRFHRGETENPGAKTLQRHSPELIAQQLVFPFDESAWFWRLIVETDELGYALRIVIVQYTEEGEFRNVWEIPVMPPVASITAASHKPRPGVELEEPPVGPKTAKEKRVAADEDK
jgi:hypothetical protein